MTKRRFQRLKSALSRRQPDLTVVIDNVNKGHNLAAIIRTCDAVGIFEVHAFGSDSTLDHFKHISAGVGKWVYIRFYPTPQPALRRLKQEGFQLLGAHPHPDALDFRQIDYTVPTAIVLGAERFGISEDILPYLDHQIVIPMLGLGRSLNVSVAAGILLYEAQAQRQQKGLYDHPRPLKDYHRILFEWAYPELATYCTQHKLTYPLLDEEGQIQGKINGYNPDYLLAKLKKQKKGRFNRLNPEPQS